MLVEKNPNKQTNPKPIKQYHRKTKQNKPNQNPPKTPNRKTKQQEKKIQCENDALSTN